MVYDINFVIEIIKRLENHNIETILFGGWAEELNKTIKPREHKDIDFLYLSDDFSKVDEFIRNNSDIVEVLEKHFPHKRAFKYSNILIELILIKNKKSKPTTNFWNEYILEWPTAPLFIEVDNLRVAKQEIIDFYRGNFDSIN